MIHNQNGVKKTDKKKIKTGQTLKKLTVAVNDLKRKPYIKLLFWFSWWFVCVCAFVCVIPFQDIPFFHHDRCRSFLVCTILHYWIYKYKWIAIIFVSLPDYIYKQKGLLQLTKKQQHWTKKQKKHLLYITELVYGFFFCPSVWIINDSLNLKNHFCNV